MLTAVSPSMAGLAESTAPTPATSQKGLVIPMSHDLMLKEAKYQSAMQMFRRMMEKGIITRENYAEAEQLMREKYKPVIGTLFSDMALT